MGEKRNAYRDLFGKPEGNRLIGRLRHRYKDSTKMDLRERRCGNRDQWRALVKMVMKLRDSIKL
jgi:hypothetical protein